MLDATGAALLGVLRGRLRARALFPAGAGAAEVADGAEEALPEPAERGLPALPVAAGSADCAEVSSAAGAGLAS